MERQTLLSLPSSVTATPSFSTLEFSAMNAGSQWDLDNAPLTVT
jgi:hypothetical protein